MAVRRRYGGRQASWGKTYAAFSEALLDCGRQLNERGKDWLIKDAESWLKETDAEWPHSSSLPNGARFGGDAMHPWYYGQLHDSVAIRIAEGNHTIAIRYMPEKATAPQKMPPRYNRIVGAEWARDIAGRAEHIYWKGSKALQSQLFVAVPYAQKVNEQGRHEGYLEELEAQFYDAMTTRISTNLVRMMVRPRK